MPPREDASSKLETLARYMEALASPVRLSLLHGLRTPARLHEIRLTAAFSRKGETPGRVISRQAVAHHLDQLLELGLVRRVPVADNDHELYVVNHERLFAFVDELRSVARIRPVLPDQASAGETMAKGTVPELRLPDRPRLLVAYGRDDGAGYSLSGPVGTRWKLGRTATCEIRLDYDPFASGEHCVVERRAGGFAVTDAPSRNGTWLNWARLSKGATRPLEAGDLLMVGRTLLLFQP